MAYKFQLGAAKLSGSIESTGGLVNTDVDDQTAANIVAEIDDGEIPSSKIADLAAFDSGDLAEGSNLYYTEARWDAKMAAADTGDLAEGSNLYYTEARWDAKMAAADTGDLAEGSNLYWTVARGESMFDNKLALADTGDLAEGSNLYYTDARVHAAVSVSDTNSIDMSYDGSGAFSADLKLDSNSGLAIFAGGLALSASVGGDGLGFSTGVLSVNVDDSSIEIASDSLQVKALGITNDMLAGSIASSKIAELNAFDTGDLAEGSNLYWTVARGESMFDNKLALADTGDLAEGSNLYYTDARSRAAVSVTDAGGDGSLAYNSSTGVITYTGPSATEVRAHFSVADSNSIDMAYNGASGEFSADVLVDSDALEVVAGGVSLKSSIAGARTFQSDVTVSGDLTVQGSLTYINTTNLAISDALITVGSGSASFAADYGLEFGAVGSGWASIKTAQENIDGVAGDDDIFKFSHPISASILATDAVVANDIYGNLTGAIVESVQVITAASGFDSANSQVLCNFSSSDTISLPAASDAQGKIYKFKKIGSGNVVIECDAGNGESIDGETSITLESAFAGVSIISDGVRFYVM